MISRFPPKIQVTRVKHYELHWTQEFPNEPNKVGECHPVTRVITLKLGEPEQEIVWTLFHEILHAINFERKLGLTEKQVTELEKSLAYVFAEIGWGLGKKKKSSGQKSL